MLDRSPDQVNTPSEKSSQHRIIVGDSSFISSTHKRNYICIASPNASIAEVIEQQLRKVPVTAQELIVQLGWREIVDGYDESYFHAEVVHLCEQLQQLKPKIRTYLVAIPERTLISQDERFRRNQFNATAKVTAELHGVAWVDDLSTIRA